MKPRSESRPRGTRPSGVILSGSAPSEAATRTPERTPVTLASPATSRKAWTPRSSAETAMPVLPYVPGEASRERGMPTSHISTIGTIFRSANGSRPSGAFPENGLRSRRHHQHHGPGAPSASERHETPDPVRPSAVNARFHCVRPASGRRPAGVPRVHGRSRRRVYGHLPGLATRGSAEMSDGLVTVCPSINGMHGRRHED
jgi:hypothetical protein